MLTSLSQVLVFNAILIAAMMFALWCVSIRIKDVSIVDIFWGFGFVLVALNTCLLSSGWRYERSQWLLSLTILWGVRLSAYLAWRNHGRPEDDRYQAMRSRRGNRFVVTSLYIVFGLQGAIMWVVSLPLQVGQGHAPLTLMHSANYLGVAIFFVGWCFESIGDYQLARFKSHPDNRGKVFDQGLWRYTRHPNYFGDFLVWWGLFILSVGRWQDLWLIISPILMSFLLIRVSGVALLDRMLKDRSPEHENYMRRTSAFIPWPPQQP